MLPEIQDYRCETSRGPCGAYRVIAIVDDQTVIGWVTTATPIVTPYVAACLRVLVARERDAA